jgi:long-chain acyl-CoA synthetase
MALTNLHGVGPGYRVAIAMRNRPEWPITFWAVTAVGAIAVPLNSWWTGPELEFAVTDSQSATVIGALERHAWLRAGANAAYVVVHSPAGEGPDGFRPLPVGGDVTSEPLVVVVTDPDDKATLIYTSGTTGRPKGVLGTHRNICSSVTSLAVVADAVPFLPRHRLARSGRRVDGGRKSDGPLAQVGRW